MITNLSIFQTLFSCDCFLDHIRVYESAFFSHSSQRTVEDLAHEVEPRVRLLNHVVFRLPAPAVDAHFSKLETKCKEESEIDFKLGVGLNL